MSLFVLDTVLWIFGIRGHIPDTTDFRRSEANRPSRPIQPRLMRVLAVVVVFVAILSLAAVGGRLARHQIALGDASCWQLTQNPRKFDADAGLWAPGSRMTIALPATSDSCHSNRIDDLRMIT